MNKINFHIGLILFSSALLAGVSSCSKQEAGDNYSYFVSSDKALSYTKDYISVFVDNAMTYYPAAGSLKPFINDDVNVYIIAYKTEVDGKEIEATGLLCLPGSPGDYPVLCFQNGTNTVDAYAPSNFVLSTSYQFIEIVASFGFAVVIPDYPGFGGSSDITHPYLIKEPTVRSTSDMLRAVKEASGYVQPGITIKDEYYLAGYSQGGWATMALHKAMEVDYSDEFTLKGSACGAGPYDLKVMMGGLVFAGIYPMPVYIGYIIYAYSTYKQFTNAVSEIIRQPYANLLPSLYNGKLNFNSINEQLTSSMSDLFTADFISGFDTDIKYQSISEALTENSISPYKTGVPLFLFHGESDEDVSPSVTNNFYYDMINEGTSTGIISKVTYPGLDHSEAAIPGLIDGFIFLTSLMKK